MSEKTLYFISGLPQAGSSLICNILKQNPEIHGQSVSSLSSLLKVNHVTWNQHSENREYRNDQAKAGTLRAIVDGYYSHIDKPIILDKSLNWTNQINMMEQILQREIKIIACVRNPAEILATYEKIRQENPLFLTKADAVLGESSSIASRAYHYAGPEGILGTTHRNLKDAALNGYADRLLFVDYNRYCNTPKAQTKRIYDFLGLTNFEHDFQNIEQTEQYDDVAAGLPGAHRVNRELLKDTINAAAYLGLDLYQQYNREIFWDAWI